MSIHIPNNSVQLSFQFACAGVTDPIVTTLGVNIDTPPKTVQEVCDTVKPLTIGAGKWLDPTQTSTSWTLLRIDGAKNVAGDISFGTAVCNTVGSAVSVAPPPLNSAVLVRKVTAQGGRKHRGRMYLPPVHVAEVDISAAGVISGGGFSQLQTRMTLFRTDLLAAGLTPALFHSDEGMQFTEIHSFVVMSLLATQRRRMR